MKDNEKQIEEMANIIDNIENNAYAQEFRWDGVKEVADSTKIANELLKYYQPKLPEDSVVLSREEYEELKAERQNLVNKYNQADEAVDYWCEKFKNASKETAEKLLNELYYIARFYYGDSANVLAWAKEKAKQLGVEIKE